MSKICKEKIKPQTFVFIVCSAFLFVKNVLFQGLLYEDLYITRPVEALKFYGASVATSIFLSSFVFLFRKNRWTCILHSLVDIWIVANVVFYRSNELFLTVDAIMMADNMSGFWSSTLAYLNWKSYIFPILTSIYTVIIWKISEAEKRRWKLFVLLIATAYLYVPVRQFRYWNQVRCFCENQGDDTIDGIWKKYYPLFGPYSAVKAKATSSYISGEMASYEATYVQRQGIVDYFAAMVVFKATYVKTVKRFRYDGDPVLTENEQSIIESQFHCPDVKDVPMDIRMNRNLIFMLVESFESWVIEYKLQDGSLLMPNLYTFMHENNIFYADKLISQAKMGVSGDGQLTVLTGMLPLITGAACKQYGENNYPNFAHFYPYSITVNPCPGVWNQSVVNSKYGIKDIYEGVMADDMVTLSKAVELAFTLEQPFFELVITMSSHTPFVKADDVDVAISPDINEFVSKYMKCMHFFDEAFGQLISSLSSTGLLENTDIIITGDHTVFKSLFLKENKSLNIERNYCPLIIYSPSFSSTVRNNDINYQMDVFPTVLGVIGADSYCWHGFGRNLITDEEPKIPVEIAGKLSDKMIRNDYFRNYQL